MSVPENYHCQRRGARVYKIRSLEDIYNLPTLDQVKNCLYDIGESMSRAKAVDDQLGKELKFNSPVFRWPDLVEWVDDDKHDNTPVFKMFGDQSKEMIKPRVCLVRGCTNRSSDGRFHGPLCSPCFAMLRDGVIGHTDSFLGDFRKAAELLKDKV
jgi:hypothetical protein